MTTDLRVGRVLRASTRGFVVGCREMRENIPAFGALVSASPPVTDGVICGLIYDVAIEDDVFVRQLVTADLPEEVVWDQANKSGSILQARDCVLCCQMLSYVRIWAISSRTTNMLTGSPERTESVRPSWM
jgi:hypothetical protein